MNTICIVYFSGTGMTEFVVKNIATAFENAGWRAVCIRMEQTAPEKMNFDDYQLIGFAYPVHSFNAPELVVRFVKKLSSINQKRTFIVYTAGDATSMNYASSKTIMKALSRKGYRVIHNELIQMPSNFAMRHSDEQARRIVKTAIAQSKQAAMKVLENKNHFDAPTVPAKILSVLGKAEWLGARMIGKFYTAGKSCILCGKCVEKCPMQNITADETTIRFHWHCAMCMRCVYNCPQKAISIRWPFRFIVFDQWYRIPL